MRGGPLGRSIYATWAVRASEGFSKESSAFKLAPFKLRSGLHGTTSTGKDALKQVRNKFAPALAHLAGCVRHRVESNHARKWDHQQVVHRQILVPLCVDGMFPPLRSRLACRSSSLFNSSTKASNFCGSCSFVMASHSCFQGRSVKFSSFYSVPSCRIWYLHLLCQGWIPRGYAGIYSEK